MKLRILLFWFTLLQSQSCFVQSCHGQRTKPLQHFWEVSPDFGDIWHQVPTDRTIRFDVELLNSTETQERVQVAQMICREHNNPSFKNGARALEILLTRLANNEQPIPSRRAMFSAATLLDDGANAAQLWKFADADPLMRSTVERSLVKWKSLVAIETWRKRLNDPQASPTDIAVALKGFAVIGGSEDTERLRGVLLGNTTTAANRHLAAIALGELNREGLNELAQQILESDVENRHQLAGNLIKQHTGDKTLAQLRSILNDGSNVAQFVAAQALLAQYPEVAREYAPKMIAHADSPIRMLALTLLEKQSDEASLRLLSQLLDDRNVEIRSLAASQLVKKAAEGQRALVDTFITEHLDAESWQGIEQATIMSVKLQDRSRCVKFVELLEHGRPEVNMHAAWALMELVQDPAILASTEPHVEKATAYLLKNGLMPPMQLSDTIRLSFLFEAFGRNKYEPIQKTLMNYIPKNGFKLGYPSRASAIWALGQINKGKDNKSLRDALSERIADLSPVVPEDQLIRFACILALGEMGFEDSRSTLVKFNEGLPYPIGHACTWAIEQLDKAKPK